MNGPDTQLQIGPQSYKNNPQYRTCERSILVTKSIELPKVGKTHGILSCPLSVNYITERGWLWRTSIVSSTTLPEWRAPGYGLPNLPALTKPSPEMMWTEVLNVLEWSLSGSFYLSSLATLQRCRERPFKYSCFFLAIVGVHLFLNWTSWLSWPPGKAEGGRYAK